MSFNIGDHVVCVLGKKDYGGRLLLAEGQAYVVSYVKEEDGEFFIRVTDPLIDNINFFASRFELSSPGVSTVIMKIRQMAERRKAA